MMGHDLLIGCVIATRAGIVGFPAFLRAGSGLTLVVNDVMIECRNFPISRIVTARAGIIGIPAFLHTSGRFCVVMDQVMTKRFHYTFVRCAVATGTMSGTHTCFRTGGRHINSIFIGIIMPQCTVLFYARIRCRAKNAGSCFRAVLRAGSVLIILVLCKDMFMSAARIG